METLTELRRAVEDAGGAVHYSLIAAVMRVSEWTAYDLLRELEALGLVVRRYVRDTPGAGRSRILFAPSAPTGHHVTSLQEQVRAVFDRFSTVADDAVAARAYLAEPAADLAYHLGFWLSRLATAGRNATDAALTVLEGGAEPAIKIELVATLGLGSMLSRLSATRLVRRLNAAARSLAQLVEDEANPPGSLDSLVDAARLTLAVPS
jgi:hypothetical protein